MTVHGSPTRQPDPASEDLPSRLLLGQNRILTLLASGTPVDQVLTEYCHLLDHSIPDVHCCIMLRDAGDGTLRVGAAPSLPAALTEGLDGLTVSPGNGSCAAPLSSSP